MELSKIIYIETAEFRKKNFSASQPRFARPRYPYLPISVRGPEDCNLKSLFIFNAYPLEV